ncbi:MAG: 23S rRNA (pseudouridine(1915)-N(3))-methyltransferase RlmH [Lachnospiraceae bacterium]|nr:23S rRNA (pseudouridine(1915)-N(3))-methyltransferase RlmH [Lachnospiraceae bacterium]
MRTDIICVGRLKEKYWEAAVAEYEKRLKAYCRLSIYELKDEKTPEGISASAEEEILKTEASRIGQYLKDKALRIVLAIEGRHYSSEEFASFLNDKMNEGISDIQFVIGGSLGLHKSIKEGAMLLSFSKMTLPHQLMRVVLLEQYYRAHKIIRHEPYHK